MDDPIRDYGKWDARQQRRIKRLPRCCICREHIQQEKALHYDGDWYCEECEGEALEQIKKEYMETVEED